VRDPLNLALRPLRNERLPTLVLAAGCLALAVLTVRHAFAARDLMPGRGSDVDREVSELERETERLRAESAELRRLAPESAALTEWAVARELVGRRAFSWTALFAALEEIVPPGVRIVSIAPAEEKGRLTLRISAVGGSVEDGLAFLEALQRREEFEGAFLLSASDGVEGSDFAYVVRYAPSPRGGKR